MFFFWAENLEVAVVLDSEQGVVTSTRRTVYKMDESGSVFQQFFDGFCTRSCIFNEKEEIQLKFTLLKDVESYLFADCRGDATSQSCLWWK